MHANVPVTYIATCVSVRLHMCVTRGGNARAGGRRVDRRAFFPLPFSLALHFQRIRATHVRYAEPPTDTHTVHSVGLSPMPCARAATTLRPPLLKSGGDPNVSPRHEYSGISCLPLKLSFNATLDFADFWRACGIPPRGNAYLLFASLSLAHA